MNLNNVQAYINPIAISGQPTPTPAFVAHKPPQLLIIASANINTLISQNLPMQTQQTHKTLVSSSETDHAPCLSQRPHHVASQGSIALEKTLLFKSCDRCQGGWSSVNQNEESNEGAERSNLLLLESVHLPAGTPCKKASIEMMSSSKERDETEEEYINRVICEQEKIKMSGQEGIATKTRRIQLDSYCNEDENNLLPIASIVKINPLNRVVECRSSESDNNSQHKTKISKNHEIATLLGHSFQSQYISEDDETLTKCENCETLQQKNISIMAENSEYVNTINQLIKKCSILSNQPQSPTTIQARDNYECFSNSGNLQSFSQQLKQQITSILNTLNYIKSPNFCQVLEFDCEDKKTVIELISSLQYLMRILEEGKDQKHQKEIKVITILHMKYKRYIEDLKESYQRKIVKMQQDFHKFMRSVSENQDFFAEHPNLFPQERVPRNCRLKRKMNSMSIERQEIKDDLMHLREQLQHLEYTNQEEKKKIRILERQNKLLAHKYSEEIAELKNQKNYHASMARKYQNEFQNFMEKAISNPKFSIICSQQFFKDISERVFQISNCIPFEQDDQQNLFAPENQEELFDMIERIRKFSLQVQEYYAQKDKEFCNIKNGITTFIKRLIDSEKVTLKNVLEIIRSSKDLQLDYLRDFLVCLKKKKTKYEEPLGQSKKKETKRKSMTLQKVDSLTFLSDQAHRNSQSQ